MKDRTLTVGLVQQCCSRDHASNLEATIDGIRRLAARNVRLVLLQELHSSLYFCQTEDPAYFDLAESIPGPTTDSLSALAAELQMVIVSSIFERRAPGLYHNTAVVLERDGGIAGRYRKMHIPDDPGYHEKFYFTPGDLGFAPVRTSVGVLGVLVCWDQWYPEAARLMALAGAELLLYPTAIGWNPSDDAEIRARERDAWITVQRGHAIANALPVMVCNRTGFEADPSGVTPGIEFWGSSFVAGPQGEFLVSAPEQDAAIVTATVDLGRTERVRQAWPYLRDRRVDAYGDLCLRYRD
jgi:N-carbamoylputrescine amidase